MDWTEIIAEVDAKDVERAENIAVMTVYIWMILGMR